MPVLALLLTSASRVSAQLRDARLVIETALAATGGSATDQRGVRSNAATLAPSLTFSRAGRVDLAIGGALTRFETGARSLGVFTGLALAQRLAPRTRLSVQGAASTARTSFASQFESVDATSAVEWAAGRVTVFAGARGALGASTFTTERAAAPTPSRSPLPLGTPGPLPSPSSVRRERFVRRGLAPLVGAQASIANARRTRTGSVSYRVDALPIDRVTIVDHQAALSLSAGRATVDAMLGRRIASDERRTFGAANVSLRASRALSVTLGGGAYPTNRVNGTFAGTFFQAGATLRAGGARRVAPTSTPVPRGAPRPAPGTTRLTIRAPNAAVVSVAGDWSAWQHQTATRGDNGVWYVDVALPEGEYRYAFRVDGAWRVPEGAAQADDGFGGKSAFVTVRGARRSRHQPTQEHP